ncbi:MAG TPA: DUF481 domain-containing protein [Gemmatimonadaceae bacterium]|nr:DUF481 domain-containing protein [Gemmatimonadaceae bacterium]
MHLAEPWSVPAGMPRLLRSPSGPVPLNHAVRVMFSTHLIRACRTVVILMGVLAAPGLAAQQLGWKGTTDASATLFFGNTSQWVVAGASQLAYSDSAIEVRGEVHADYAETATDSGGSVVSRRAWLVSVGADWTPYALLSPFVLGSAESSLQQRIARRYSAGAGGKLSFVRKPDAALSASLALLWEHTAPTVFDSTTNLDGSRLRWSFRLKASRTLDERLHFTHVSFYQPSVKAMQHFTLTSTTTLAFDLTRTFALTASLYDTYDSEARRRGARSNNDGQLLLGVRARY